MELCLITCNIRFDNPGDGINSWSTRKKFLSETLLKHSPDIIATQEGRFDQLKDFENTLASFQIIDSHRSWIRERMYPSIFIKKSKFEILNNQDLWLSETPNIPGSSAFDSAFPRLMTVVTLEDKVSRFKFNVINTHLDHIKKETRNQQIQILVSEGSKLLDPTIPLFVLGDFNDHPESEVRSILTNKFQSLRDAWKCFNNLEETSHHGFKGKDPNGSRIDWILIDQNIKLIECFMDKTYEGDRYPSDHYPVICKVKF